jgi:hypothetical protein
MNPSSCFDAMMATAIGSFFEKKNQQAEKQIISVGNDFKLLLKPSAFHKFT